MRFFAKYLKVESKKLEEKKGQRGDDAEKISGANIDIVV